VSRVLQSAAFQDAELILGYVNNADLRLLAHAAQQKKIPFININLPNDGNITDNPEFIMLNSTLKTHCEAIYKFLQKNYSTVPITYFYTEGAIGERLKKYFMDAEKTTVSVPLHLNFVSLKEPLGPNQLFSYLDSTRQNVFIGGFLNIDLIKKFCTQLTAVGKTYATTIMGMPTWDNIDFTQPDFGGLEIYYTTPFYNNPSDTLVKYIDQYFKAKFYSRPSDMVFRGYESMYHFAKLLQQYGSNLSGSIGEKKFKVFEDFDIEPVFQNKQNMTLDYFENKKLYFVKIVDGNIAVVY
jgi:hypothetical protein